MARKTYSEQELVRALARLPEVVIRSFQAQPVIAGRRLDVAILTEVRGRPVRFLIEAKAYAYARDVREAIWQLAGMRRLEESPVDIPMVAAPALPHTSRELLREAGLAYLDAGGSIHVNLPWAFYLVDRPVPPKHERKLRRVYRGSTAQVLHALLAEPTRSWHMTDLAERAEVSISTVHQVCSFLEQQLWMTKHGSGPRSVRVLDKPGPLLDSWLAAHSLAAYEPKHFHRWSSDPVQSVGTVTDALGRRSIEYALTLESGAGFVAPYATNIAQLSILVPESALGLINEIAREADLRSVEEGENVVFMVTRGRSPLLFRRRIHDVWVASDVQLCLDLWAWPRRGEDQARHLRTERLGY